MLTRKDLKIGKTYRGKKPRTIRDPNHPCVGSMNDRKILAIDGDFITFTGPALLDGHPPKMKADAFLAWAGNQID